MTRKDAQDTQASILLINFVDQMSILGINPTDFEMSLFIDDRAVRVEEAINVGIDLNWYSLSTSPMTRLEPFEEQGVCEMRNRN